MTGIFFPFFLFGFSFPFLFLKAWGEHNEEENEGEKGAKKQEKKNKKQIRLNHQPNDDNPCGNIDTNSIIY